MTDSADQIFGDFEKAIAKAIATASAEALIRMRAISARPLPTPSPGQREPPTDLIFPGEAVHLSGLSRAHVYRLCKLTRYRIEEPGGFAIWMKDQNCWMVSRSLFELFLNRRPRRKRDSKRRNTGPVRHRETS